MSNKPASQSSCGHESRSSQYYCLPCILRTNLHILRLDQSDEGSSISSQTFSTNDSVQNRQNRIRCWEWTLYHLFKIWDPKETNEVSIIFGFVERFLTIPGSENESLFPTTVSTSVPEPSSCIFQGSQRPE